MSREEKGASSKAKLRGTRHQARTEPRIGRSRYERRYRTYWRARHQGHPGDKPKQQGLRSTMNPYHKEQQSWGRRNGNNKDERGLTDLPPESRNHFLLVAVPQATFRGPGKVLKIFSETFVILVTSNCVLFQEK